MTSATPLPRPNWRRASRPLNPTKSTAPLIEITDLLVATIHQRGTDPTDVIAALRHADVPNADAALARWTSGGPVATRTDLCALVTYFHWTLDDLVASTSAPQLVRLLWNTATGDHLATHLRTSNVTASDLAVSTSTLRRWTKGHTAPTLAPLLRALELTHLDARDLLTVAGPLTAPTHSTPFATWLANGVLARMSTMTAAQQLGIPRGTLEGWRHGRSYPYERAFAATAATFTTAGYPLTTADLTAMRPPRSPRDTTTLPALARTLYTARLKAGLDVADIATATGVQPSSIVSWEHGSTRPGRAHWPTLRALLQLDLTELQTAYAEQEGIDDSTRGRWVRLRRQLLGMEAADLGEHLGLPKHQVKWLESGGRTVHVNTEMLATVLQATPAQLLAHPPAPLPAPHPEGLALRQLRIARGMTGTELATLTGLPLKSLRHIERGSYLPSPPVRQLLETALAATNGDR